MPFESKSPDAVLPDSSLYEFLIERVRKGNKNVAVIDNSRQGRSITFEEIDEYSQNCAGYLHKQGLKKGDIVGVCASSSIEYPVIILSILACGATVTFCNPAFTKDEILQQFRISKPKMVFVDEEAEETMKLVQEELYCIKNIFVKGKSQEFTTYNSIIQGKHTKDFPSNWTVNPKEDIALVPYSSGTTGLPKSVMLTHKNVVSFLAIKSALQLTESDSIYIDRPIYHGGGFGMLLFALAGNAKQVLNRIDDVEDMLQAVEKYKVTKFLTVPSFVVRCVGSDIANKYDVSSVEKIFCGGAPIAHELLGKMKETFNAQIIQVYGTTEGRIPAVNTEYETYPKSVGTLLPNAKMKIVDFQTGKELTKNESGEILIKGPTVMKGYLNDDQATKNAFTDDGWFRTGDIGYFDKDERLYIVDRIKEVIKYKSVQVSPAELESVIFRLPQVADVGVIGIPHEFDVEVPKAFVVKKDESLSPDKIHAIVKDELADYKQLRGGIAFVSKIPKSPTGKIQRNELKKMAGIV